MNDLAINIDYWGMQEGKNDIWQLAGITEFKNDLSQHYISRIHGRPGDLGGGLYELAVQIIADISLKDVTALIAGGVAFDILKLGAKSFALRPFLAAYSKLKAQNADRKVDIDEIKFMFNDAEVTITKISSNSIYESLGGIFKVLAEDFSSLINGEGEYPYEIQIPVFEDPEKKLCRFRVLLDVDETIKGVTNAAYMGFWGIYYDYESISRIFDVKRKLLIDSDFLTLDRYWKEWDRVNNNNKTSS